MDMNTALDALGVREDTLSAAEKTHLDTQGFLVLPAILSPDQLSAIGQRLDELLGLEGDQAGLEVHQEQGTERLANLVNKGAIFAVCFTHPRVLAAVAQVIGHPFRLSSLNSRGALPGQGAQGFHVDWAKATVAAGDYYACNTAWLLDPFTIKNGPTRVVPGSHRSDQTIAEAMPDPKAPHPDEIQVIAPAGSVLVFNAHLWHSGTLNYSAQRRRVVHAYFGRRTHPQQTDQRAHLAPETYGRLSEAARYLLDV